MTPPGWFQWTCGFRDPIKAYSYLDLQSVVKFVPFPKKSTKRQKFYISRIQVYQMKRYGRLGQFFKTPTHCPVLGQNVFFVCSPVKKLPLLQPQLKHHKWFLSDAKKTTSISMRVTQQNTFWHVKTYLPPPPKIYASVQSKMGHCQPGFLEAFDYPKDWDWNRIWGKAPPHFLREGSSGYPPEN